MLKIPTLVEMLEAGVHFGHRTSRWHPKMREFIFGENSGVHIINLEETQKQLDKACEFVKGIASRGGVVLFVATKSQAKEIIERCAKECGMPYVNTRWLGGTLTNFVQIKTIIRKLTTLEDQQAKGELHKYTKKEQLMFSREIDDMRVKVGGIQTMDKTPSAIFIVDIKTEKTALAEAKTIGVPIVAICDTNTNPRDIDYVIPANDDSVKSIEMICSLMSKAILEGKSEIVDMTAVSATPTIALASKDDSVITPDEVLPLKETVAAVEDLDEKIHEELVSAKIEEEKNAVKH